jgi:hypothetical protein
VNYTNFLGHDDLERKHPMAKRESTFSGVDTVFTFNDPNPKQPDHQNYKFRNDGANGDSYDTHQNHNNDLYVVQTDSETGDTPVGEYSYHSTSVYKDDELNNTVVHAKFEDTNYVLHNNKNNYDMLI